MAAAVVPDEGGHLAEAHGPCAGPEIERVGARVQGPAVLAVPALGQEAPGGCVTVVELDPDSCHGVGNDTLEEDPGVQEGEDPAPQGLLAPAGRVQGDPGLVDGRQDGRHGPGGAQAAFHLGAGQRGCGCGEAGEGGPPGGIRPRLVGPDVEAEDVVVEQFRLPHLHRLVVRPRAGRRDRVAGYAVGPAPGQVGVDVASRDDGDVPESREARVALADLAEGPQELAPAGLRDRHAGREHAPCEEEGVLGELGPGHEAGLHALDLVVEAGRGPARLDVALLPPERQAHEDPEREQGPGQGLDHAGRDALRLVHGLGSGSWPSRFESAVQASA